MGCQALAERNRFYLTTSVLDSQITRGSGHNVASMFERCQNAADVVGSSAGGRVRAFSELEIEARRTPRRSRKCAWKRRRSWLPPKYRPPYPLRGLAVGNARLLQPPQTSPRPPF